MSTLIPRSFIVTRVFLRRSEVQRILSNGFGISRSSVSLAVVSPVNSPFIPSNRLRRCKQPLLVPYTWSSCQCCHNVRRYSSQVEVWIMFWKKLKLIVWVEWYCKSFVFQGEKRKVGLPERIVDATPASLQPYLRLSRMHRPIGKVYCVVTEKLISCTAVFARRHVKTFLDVQELGYYFGHVHGDLL